MKSPMSCRRMGHLLPELAAGDLDPLGQAAVREHLEGCFACTRSFAEAVECRDALALLRAGPGGPSDEDVPGAPPGFFQRMREEVLAAVAAMPRSGAAERPRGGWLRASRTTGGPMTGARLAAAAVLLFATGFGLGAVFRAGPAWEGDVPGPAGAGNAPHSPPVHPVSHPGAGGVGGLRQPNEEAVPVWTGPGQPAADAPHVPPAGRPPADRGR